MVWPLKKSRRQSQSPSSVGSASSPPRRHRAFFASRHKRRITQKDSNITMLTECSSSSGSDKTISAPWRVDNIRAAPPKSDEWWTEESASDSKDYSDGEGAEAVVTSVSSISTDNRRFHNCGLETWMKAREEWKKRTVETLPPKPTPAEYNQLVRGLIKHSAQRTYELPRKMALSDLIDVYNDIWEGQGL